MRIVLCLITGLILASCDKFEYDPNQTKDYNSPDLLNISNIYKIQSKGVDTLIQFALISDSHSYYAAMEEVIDAINRDPEIDFVIHAGDITDYGYLTEYEWGINRLQKLKVPFVVAIGNHDLLANGDEVYENLFSEVNFSFIYNDVKFIFFDSNGREYGFNGTVPNIPFILHEINYGTNFHKVILVSHVPYSDGDFDPALRAPYEDMLDDHFPGKEILLSLSGHIHEGYDSLMNSTIRHLNPGSMGKRGYYVVTITPDTMRYEKRNVY